MDNKRETGEFKTKTDKVIIHYTYLTGRENNEIQKIYLKDANVNLIGDVVKVDGFNPISDMEANEKMLELMVVSVDGKTEKVADIILDLPNEECEEIIAKINNLTDKKKS